MELETFQIAYQSELVDNYLRDFPKVSPLFNYNPHQKESFRKRLAVVNGKYTVDRGKLVAMLRKYNQKLGCGEKTLFNIERLAQEGATMIITGQQPGVFTGPLYTIYKAMTAIQLAARMSDELGNPVVPVFWVGGEDHDFGEIHHIDLLSRENRVERIRLEESPEQKVSVGTIPITTDMYKLIDKLAEATPDTEFKAEIISGLRVIAEKSANLGDWFAGIMNWFFSDYGLIILNPMEEEYRLLGQEIYKEFIRQNPQIREQFARGQERVKELGFRPQVEKEDNNSHLFIYIDNERLPLLTDGEFYYIRGREQKWTATEILDLIDRQPELLSGNVVLKPISQDYTLPILAYIAGPGEIGYYALYKDVYQVVGMEMPIIYPRANITLLEKGIARYMEKYHLNLQKVMYEIDDQLQDMLKRADEIGVDQLFADFKESFTKEYRNVIERLSVLDKNLTNLGEENIKRIISQVEHLEGKARQQLRKNNEDGVRQFEKIRLNLRPHDNWQERVYNIFPYTFKYGLDLIDQLLSLPLIDSFDHKLVYL